MSHESSGKALVTTVPSSVHYEKDGGSIPRGSDTATCPVCGQAGAREWLRAPDRLHGRQECYVLVRCQVCSLVWLSNAPRLEDMSNHYTDAYHRLISGSGENSPGRWQDRMETLERLKKSGTLLDLGCSSGGFIGLLRREAWKLYGIEMSADCARRAEQRTGAHVFVGNIPDAPFLPQSFDVITCFDVLEHLYQPTQIMAKVREWLKPGGIFYVQVPNIDSVEARVFGSYWHGLEIPRHLFHYCPASLKFLGESTGLETVLLETRQNPAVGTSLRYVFDDMFRGVGVHRIPVAYRDEAGLAWRASRKLVRLTGLRLMLAMAPLFGDGESIHAIFQKGSN